MSLFCTQRDAGGKEKRVLNSKETTLAQQKQQAIKDAFRDWIWKNPDRRRELVQLYNERFNSTRPREYDGRHLIFPGMNPEITLREHQRGAIAHDLYGGNTLLAHEVGAGKTFEMIAAAMEGKRLGLCQKSLFAVPNHLTEQWASEFLRLYPSANILVATKKDFETRNRKKFCARIATGDYDAVIIGHSQFERIPVSRERQERLLQDRMLYVLAATVRHFDYDGRISQDNKRWANTIPVYENKDGMGGDSTTQFVVCSHPGLTDLFLTQTRHEQRLRQPLTADEIKAEATQLLGKLQEPNQPNSPGGTHFISELSPDFAARTNSRDTAALQKLLPFSSLALTTLKDRMDVYAMEDILQNQERIWQAASGILSRLAAIK